MLDPLNAFSTLIATSGVDDTVVATGPLAPALIVALCVVAGLATWLLLPGQRERAIQAVGGVILLGTALIFGALLVKWTINLGGMSVYFWLFSAVALFGSIRVITHTKPVYSALYFVLTVFATAGLFVLMWAEFMAAALVLIYAGAILITYVFVIMLASEASTGTVGASAESVVSEHDAEARMPLSAALVGFAVMGLLVFVIFDKMQQMPERIDRAGEKAELALKTTRELPEAGYPEAVTLHNLGSAPALGQELIERHAVNLQIAAVVLTVAMVGAITLARRRVITAEQPESIETLTTPGTPVDDNPHSIPVYGTTNPRHKEYPEN